MGPKSPERDGRPISSDVAEVSEGDLSRSSVVFAGGLPLPPTAGSSRSGDGGSKSACFDFLSGAGFAGTVAASLDRRFFSLEWIGIEDSLMALLEWLRAARVVGLRSTDRLSRLFESSTMVGRWISGDDKVLENCVD